MYPLRLRSLPSTSWALAGLLLCPVAAGLGLRILALGRQPTGSDQAVVGLMAVQILHGHLSAFYWGQQYGGGEPYVVAAMFALFGQSGFTLGLTPVLLDGVAALLVWRIGCRLFSPVVGVVAAVLFWIWPEVYVWQSTLEYGFRFLALDCGLGMLLVALRISQRQPQDHARWGEWCLFGILAGIGWWCTPEIVYYAVPVVGMTGWGVIRRRTTVSPAALLLGSVSCAVGMLPWLWANVKDGFASLRTTRTADSGFSLHLRIVGDHVLPMLLGLQLRTTGAWLDAPLHGVGTRRGAVADLAHVLYWLALATGVTWCIRLLLTRRARVLVGFALFFPLAYAWFPVTWFWQDGRYAVFAAPVVALLAVSATDAVGRALVRMLSRTSWVRRPSASLPPSASSPRWVALAVLVLGAAALTGAAVDQLAPYRPAHAPGHRGWLSWQSDPNSAVAQLATGLEHDHVHDAYAGYWLAYVLDFESRERITASDVGAYVRYRPYLQAVERARKPAWLFSDPGLSGQLGVEVGTSLLDLGCQALHQPCLLAGALEAYLQHHHIGYEVLDVGDFQAVIPRSRVAVAPVFATAHVEA